MAQEAFVEILGQGADRGVARLGQLAGRVERGIGMEVAQQGVGVVAVLLVFLWLPRVPRVITTKPLAWGIPREIRGYLALVLLFGLAMVIVMIWKPRGFVGNRSPTAFLYERKNVSSSFTKEGHG